MIILILVIYLVILLYAVGKIFRYVKNPAKTLLWLLMIIVIPVFGLLFYFLMGLSPRKDKLFKQKSPFYQLEAEGAEMNILPETKQYLAKLLRHNQSAAISSGNHITILQNGEETFDAIFEAIRGAKSTIHLDYYIIEAGKTLDELLSICKEKISEGVKVRMIFDGFGSFYLSKKYLRQFKDIGIEYQEFFPFHLFNLIKFVNYRNHRKIIIVDNRIGFTGGMNISDKYLEGNNRLGRWRDTFIRIQGPAVKHLERVFQADWFYAKGLPYSTPKDVTFDETEGAVVQIIASGPDSEHRGIMQEFFTIITQAKEYVYIVTPYFVPGEALMTALKTAALGGIDVRLMLPYDSDSRWMKWCMFTYLEELLAAGVKIYLFHEGFLHGKVIISDDIVSSVGTANIDDRSFEANFEVNALVYDLQTCLTLKAQFADDMAYCEALQLSSFPHRSDHNRVMEPLARLISTML